MTAHEANPEPGPKGPARGHGILLVVGMLLLAANLRPPLTEVSPVVAQIRRDYGISGGEASFLTTLPVLLFGLCAFATLPLLRRLGIARTVLLALIVLMAGSLIRLLPNWPVLLVGTALVGASIAVGNIVLPVLVKTRFPHRTGQITGLYTMALTAAAAAAAGTVVPLAALSRGGWRGGFLIWTVPIAGALVCWALLGLRRRRRPVNRGATGVAVLSLIKNSRARALVVFTASQSLIYYGIIAWLPSIFQDHGYSPAGSGLLLSLTTIVGAPVALVVPAMATRARDQRAHVVVLAACAGAGLGGLLVAPVAAPYLWVVLLGIGQGGVFPLALTLFVLRAANGAETAALSVLAQSVAYVVAAMGPLAMGVARDRTGTWTAAIIILLACLGVQLVSGLSAGKAGPLSLGSAPRPSTGSPTQLGADTSTPATAASQVHRNAGPCLSGSLNIPTSDPGEG